MPESYDLNDAVPIAQTTIVEMCKYMLPIVCLQKKLKVHLHRSCIDLTLPTEAISQVLLMFEKFAMQYTSVHISTFIIQGSLLNGNN